MTRRAPVVFIIGSIPSHVKMVMGRLWLTQLGTWSGLPQSPQIDLSRWWGKRVVRSMLLSCSPFACLDGWGAADVRRFGVLAGIRHGLPHGHASHGIEFELGRRFSKSLCEPHLKSNLDTTHVIVLLLLLLLLLLNWAFPSTKPVLVSTEGHV